MPCSDLLYGEHGCLQPASSRSEVAAGGGGRTGGTPSAATDPPPGPRGAPPAEPTGSRSLGSPRPTRAPLPSIPARLAVFSPSPPPRHRPPKPPSARFNPRGGGRAASRPAASLPPHPLRGRLSSPGVCGHGPAAPRLPRGGLACPRPRAAQVSGHRRGGGGLHIT